VTDVPTWVLLLLRIASGNQYTQDTPKGENHIAGKAQIGVESAQDHHTFSFRIFLPITSMSEYFHPNIPHPELPYWRPPPWLKYQAFKFLLENPSTTCVPSTTSDLHNSPDLVESSGKKRELEEEIESNWIPP